MNFTKYPATQQIERGNTVYADVVNHCNNYKDFVVNGSISTSVHEITHGINANLRNGAIKATSPGGPCRQYVPTLVGSERSNAFYVLQDRAIRLKEPNKRKSDCIKFIPTTLRNYRYGTYVAGQQAWDDSPLYIFDEWIAYSNGAANVIQQSKDGTYKDGASDYIFGPLEFVVYAAATLMAAGDLDPLLVEFSNFQFRRVFNIYFEGIKLLPWADADKLYGQLKSGSEANDIRTFLKQKIAFTIPDAFVPDDNPSNVDWVM
jgi:hypothetical protein